MPPSMEQIQTVQSSSSSSTLLELIVPYLNTATCIGLVYRTCKRLGDASHGVVAEADTDTEVAKRTYPHDGFHKLRCLAARLKAGHVEVVKTLLREEEDECILAEDKTENGGLFPPYGLLDAYKQLANAVVPLEHGCPGELTRKILEKDFNPEFQLAVMELGKGIGMSLDVNKIMNNKTMRAELRLCNDEKPFPTISMWSHKIPACGVIAGNFSINVKGWKHMSVPTFTRVLLKILFLIRETGRHAVRFFIPEKVEEAVYRPQKAQTQTNYEKTLAIALYMYEAVIRTNPLFYESIEPHHSDPPDPRLLEWAIKYSEPEF